MRSFPCVGPRCYGHAPGSAARVGRSRRAEWCSCVQIFSIYPCSVHWFHTFATRKSKTKLLISNYIVGIHLACGVRSGAGAASSVSWRVSRDTHTHRCNPTRDQSPNDHNPAPKTQNPKAAMCKRQSTSATSLDFSLYCILLYHHVNVRSRRSAHTALYAAAQSSTSVHVAPLTLSDLPLHMRPSAEPEGTPRGPEARGVSADERLRLFVPSRAIRSHAPTSGASKCATREARGRQVDTTWHTDPGAVAQTAVDPRPSCLDPTPASATRHTSWPAATA